MTSPARGDSASRAPRAVTSSIARQVFSGTVEHTGLPTSEHRLWGLRAVLTVVTGVRKTRGGHMSPAQCRPWRGSSIKSEPRCPGVGAHALPSRVTPGHPDVTGTAEGGQAGKLSCSPHQRHRWFMVYEPVAHLRVSQGPRGTASTPAGRKGQPAAEQTGRAGGGS